MQTSIFALIIIHSFIHFWHAPLRVRSANRGHQSLEWAILINCNTVIIIIIIMMINKQKNLKNNN